MINICEPGPPLGMRGVGRLVAAQVGNVPTITKLGKLYRFEYGLRILLYDQEKFTGCSGRASTALLPILKRSD